MSIHSKFLSVFFFIVFAASSWAQTTSVGGKWDLTVQTPHGAMTLELDLKQDGTAVTGTVLNFRNERQPVKGELKGTQLTLETTSGDDMALSATLKSDGTLAGQLSVAQGDVNWTAKRVGKS
ncbi:MAG TPA: hypothetical protein VEA16_05235 [Vicinamibacterales bacterium]|nr:hypothetical protein [Vicinamibacterales bacterium]